MNYLYCSPSHFDPGNFTSLVGGKGRKEGPGFQPCMTLLHPTAREDIYEIIMYFSDKNHKIQKTYTSPLHLHPAYGWPKILILTNT